MIGVEAFLRWHHPEKGLVSAQQFINLAEETGLIVRLGELALRQACIQVQALERAGFESLKMAVNLSVRQLTDSGFLDMIRQVITETGVSPERLELEMPAELLNEDPRMLRELLVSLNDLGVCLILMTSGPVHARWSRYSSSRWTSSRLIIGLSGTFPITSVLPMWRLP